MVFKRGVALLAIAATAALVSVEAGPIKVQTDMKNPVVKDVKMDHGKLVLTLEEGATIKKAKHHAAKHHVKHHDEKKKKHHAAVKHTDVKKIDVKKPTSVKVQHKKDQHKKHPEVKKHESKKTAHKQVSEEKTDSGEVIRKYKHGQVRVMAKDQPTTKHKKHAKKVVGKQVVDVTVDEEASGSAEEASGSAEESSGSAEEASGSAEEASGSAEDTVISAEDEADVDLKVGEAVTIVFGEHTVDLELLANGSLVVTADNDTYVLPQADSIDLTIDDVDDSDSGSADAAPSVGSGSAAVGEVTLLGEVEGEAEVLAKKFTELATKLTGNGKFFSKEAAPIVFVGGCIGVLAAIVGIAAIAVGRSRRSAAAADPASVLADATEDVEADVEAAASSSEKKSSDDAAADETQSLDSLDSDSDAEEGSEEGKFTNGVVSV